MLGSRAGDLYIYDLDSVHGTFLNRIRIQASSYVPIHNGDFITFGASRRQYFVDGGPSKTVASSSGVAHASTSTQASAASHGGHGGAGGGGASSDVTAAASSSEVSKASLSGPIGEEGREMFSGNALGMSLRTSLSWLSFHGFLFIRL